MMPTLRWSAQALTPVVAEADIATATPHDYYVHAIPMVRCRFALRFGESVGQHVPANVRSLLWVGQR